MLKAVKSEEIRARVNPSELMALKLVAQHDRRNMSEVLRELIREAAQQRGLWPPPEQAGRGATT